MMIKFVIFSWVAVIFVSAEMQLYPTNTDDLQSIVQSVKDEVDRHVKLMSKDVEMENVAETSDESAIPQEPSIEKYAGMDDEISIDDTSVEIVEYLSDAAEAYYGSVKGRPGVDFPDYTDIPKTSFTCSGKTMHPPGFYADMETGCQVFHVCWPERRESFLCPMGTIFNQAISACDYWYNSNCSLAYLFYETSSEFSPDSSKSANVPMAVPVHKTNSFKSNNPATDVIFFVSEFMPVKAKIVFYPKTEKQRPKIVLTASTGKSDKGSKSRKRSRYSKHSRVPRSVEFRSRYDDPLHKLKTNITFYRTWEFMNTAVETIRNKESTAHLAPYAERIKEFFKSWILMDETPVMVHVEPGSELEKYDQFLQEGAKNLTLIFRKFVELGAWFMRYDPDDSEETKERNWKALQEDDEFLALINEPLTNLNPRFIVKKPAEMKSKERDGKTFEKSRIKRDASTLNPLELVNDDENIYPETKEALLKSYVKLFKKMHA